MRFTAKTIAYRVALVGATICLLVAVLFTVFGRSFFLPAPFAERAAASLGDPGVAAFVADRITDEIIARKPDLVGARPLVLAAVTEIIGSPPFRAVARVTAWRSYQALFSESSRDIILSIPDLDVLVRGALTESAPEIAQKIPEGLTAQLASLGTSRRLEVVVDLWRLGRKMRALALAAFIAVPLLLVLAFWTAPRRARSLVHDGVSVGIAGFVLLLILPAGRLVTASLIDNLLVRHAVDGVARSYLGGLRIYGMLFVGLGVVFVAASSSLVQTLDVLETGRRLASRVVHTPAARTARIARGAAFLVAGVLLVLFPRQALTGAVLLGGSILAMAGLRELFSLILTSRAASVTAARTAARMPVWRVAAVLGLGTIAAVIWVLVHNPAATVARGPILACNGHPELCDRRVDQVVFAGAHNAMANAEISDWMFPNQMKAIPTQLQDGIRALLIDVHRGFPGGERIETDLEGEKVTKERLLETLGPEGVKAATRIRNRLVGVDENRPGLYLCHGFCELGASDFVGTLRDVREFLVRNPDEVLIFVLEDYVTVEEIARAFDESGLQRFVYTGTAPPWPTLRELIQSGERLIVFLESGNPGVAWLRPMVGNIQETPYTFHDPSEFTCVPNRGGTKGTLFQINHWIETLPAPKPANAEVVNARDVLLGRAQQCAKARGHLPNIIAVDFYSIGDLFAVVDTLNAVGAPELP